MNNRVSRCQSAALLLSTTLILACRESAPPPLPPPTVEVAPVEKVPSARDLRLSGSIEAERSVALSFSVPGTVEEVAVREGQAVRRGQVLARLSDASLRHSLGMAEAKAAQAEDAARRLEPMHRNGTVPEVKWVEVQTGLAEARHSVALAQKSVEDAVLRAPEDGVIARRSVEVGASALPALAAFTLVRLDTALAVVPVPENEVAKVRAGQPAVVHAAALGRDLAGAVREIGVEADPLTRTYPVKIAVPNRDGLLRVGMVVDARIGVDAGATALAVPREAVRIDERGAPCVFVVGADGRLSRRAVTLAGFAGERTALAGGVAEGDRVVVSGTPMLGDGVVVRVAAHLGGEG
jgi:RND family efflux transporter MFP subunit